MTAAARRVAAAGPACAHRSSTASRMVAGSSSVGSAAASSTRNSGWPPLRAWSSCARSGPTTNVVASRSSGPRDTVVAPARETPSSARPLATMTIRQSASRRAACPSQAVVAVSARWMSSMRSTRGARSARRRKTLNSAATSSAWPAPGSVSAARWTEPAGTDRPPSRGPRTATSGPINSSAPAVPSAASASTASNSGWNGKARPSSSHLTITTGVPEASTRRRQASSNRDFPMPASPSTSPTWPWPRCARSNSASSSAIASPRPGSSTAGVGGEAVAVSRPSPPGDVPSRIAVWSASVSAERLTPRSSARRWRNPA